MEKMESEKVIDQRIRKYQELFGIVEEGETVCCLCNGGTHYGVSDGALQNGNGEMYGGNKNDIE